MLRPRGFRKDLTSAQLYTLLRTCFPYLRFADMQEEAAHLMLHYVLKHRLRVENGQVVASPGYRAAVQTALERTRFRAQRVPAPEAFALALLGDLDTLVEEVWPDQDRLEGRRRLALQLLAGVYELKWTGTEYVRLQPQRTSPVETIRARNRNLRRLQEQHQRRR